MKDSEDLAEVGLHPAAPGYTDQVIVADDPQVRLEGVARFQAEDETPFRLGDELYEVAALRMGGGWTDHFIHQVSIFLRYQLRSKFQPQSDQVNKSNQLHRRELDRYL